MNKNSVYANCHNKKLLILSSPPGLINRSGSGSPAVYKLFDIKSSLISSILISLFLNWLEIFFTALTISALPP